MTQTSAPEGAAPAPGPPAPVGPVRGHRHGTTLQAFLQREPGPGEARGDGPRPGLDDPVAFFRHLEASGDFHRDTGLGRIYHPGSVSFRENVPDNSLHVIIDGNHVSAHVDRVSPLEVTDEGPSKYALGRIALHNASGVASDVARLLRGRQGDHRCELDCEWDPAGDVRSGVRLVDPVSSPWSVQIEAEVAGTLDADRLRAAFAAVAPGPDPLTVYTCDDDVALGAARVELQAVAVPFDRSPPLRARLVQRPAGSVLMLNVNHAAADGPGALQVLRAVAGAYARPGDEHQPLDFLATIKLPVRPAASGMPYAARKYRASVERVRDALAQPTRLMPENPTGDPGHGFLLLRLDEDDPASLGHLRDPDGDNDVLLAALHLAVATWNREHGHPGGRVSVLVPVDLRSPGWRPQLVLNGSVMARVSTDDGDRASPAVARQAVMAQTARNIRTRTGTALMHALDRHGLLPLWARQSVVVLQPLTANHLLDSAVLSYAGRVDPVSFGDDAGAAGGLHVSTPARMPQGLAIGGAVVGGRLHLSFRYPHQLFSAEGAQRFAELVLAQIRLVASAPQ